MMTVKIQRCKWIGNPSIEFTRFKVTDRMEIFFSKSLNDQQALMRKLMEDVIFFDNSFSIFFPFNFSNVLASSPVLFHEENTQKTCLCPKY